MAANPKSLRPNSLRVDQAVDDLCNRFEAAFTAGEHPRIEDYLPPAHDPVRSKAFDELLRVEFELRKREGGHPGWSDYLDRFPDYREAIEQVFSVSIGVLESTCNLPPDTSQTILPAPISGVSGIPPVAGQFGRSPDGPATPARIGRYQIVRLLGAGAFGSVYLAHDEKLDRQVAIKVPRVSGFGSHNFVARFVDEARLAARLKHPGIIAIYDVGQESDDTPFVVMEFVDGETLQTRLVAGRLPIAEVVRILAAVADPVHYAHKQGIFHRDLKPANIILDSHGNPHVADFGLAVHEDAQAAHRGERSGTAAYMSPEQVVTCPL